jgi:hypothetical protein
MAYDDVRKSSVKLLVTTKAMNLAFGPLFNFALKIKRGFKGIVSIFKKSAEGAKGNAKAMEGMAESAEVVDGLFKSTKLSMLMTIGSIFAIIAAFGYLTGAFGQFANEGLGAGDIFGKLKDVISGVVDFIKGIGEKVSPVFMQIGENVMILAGIILGMDWSPITDMLMLAFGAIGMLIADFAVAAIGFFGELFTIFTTLMTYLADTGILQQIIDIIGIVGTTVILVIGSIFAALDMLGINFGSIFGFITDVVGGFVSFLIDSGLLGFLFDVMAALALLLSAAALVFAGIMLIVADFLSYFTGPTWQILTGVIGAIVDFIAISLAVVLGVIRVVLNLAMLPFRILFGFITGGWDGAKKGAGKSLGNIAKIVKSTAAAIWSRLGSLAGNIGKVFVGAFNLITAPIQYVIDKVKDLIGYITDLLDIDLGDIADKIPGAGLVSDAAGFIGGLFATGGISRGPQSGYQAVLHGTEAVVPLPDGQSIPVDFRGTVEVQQEGGSGMRELNRTMRRMFTPISNIPQSIEGLFDRPISATLEGEPIAHDIDIKVEHDGESERILTTISGNIERLVKLMAEVPQIITGVVDKKPAPVLDSWMRDIEVDVTHEPIEIEPIEHEIEVKVDHEPIDPIEVKVDHEPIEIDIDVKVEHEEIARQPIVELSRQLGGVLDRYQDLEVDVTYEPIKHEVDVRVEHDPIEHDDIDIRVEHEPIEIEVSQPPITINAIPAIKQLIKQLIKPILVIPQVIGRLFEGRILPVAVKSGIDTPEINLTPAVRAIDNLSGPINSIPQALTSVFRQLIKPIITIPQMIRGLFEGRIIPVAVKSGVEIPEINLIPAVRAIDNLSGPINSIPQALAGVFYGRVIPVSINDDITIGRLLDGRTIPVSIQNSGETNLGENVTFNINVSGGGDASKIAKAVTREVQRAFRTRARSGGFGRGI